MQMKQSGFADSLDVVIPTTFSPANRVTLFLGDC